MELKTMTKKDLEQAIADHTAVKMALEYLDECAANEEQPDADWLRFLLMGCPVEPWVDEILREEDCPEVPMAEKMTPRGDAQDVGED